MQFPGAAMEACLRPRQQTKATKAGLQQPTPGIGGIASSWKCCLHPGPSAWSLPKRDLIREEHQFFGKALLLCCQRHASQSWQWRLHVFYEYDFGPHKSTSFDHGMMVMCVVFVDHEQSARRRWQMRKIEKYDSTTSTVFDFQITFSRTIPSNGCTSSCCGQKWRKSKTKNKRRHPRRTKCKMRLTLNTITKT